MGSSTDESLTAALAKDVAAKSTASPARRWFYTQGGKKYGPVTALELRAAARLGFLDALSRVRCGQDGDWGRAPNIQGLFEGDPCDDRRPGQS